MSGEIGDENIKNKNNKKNLLFTFLFAVLLRMSLLIPPAADYCIKTLDYGKRISICKFRAKKLTKLENRNKTGQCVQEALNFMWFCTQHLAMFSK